jgi:hypothetical protein
VGLNCTNETPLFRQTAAVPLTVALPEISNCSCHPAGEVQRPLPDWAGEMGCTSWAQILLKFVLAQPAVTCVIPGTGSTAHMADNCRAGTEMLPDVAYESASLLIGKRAARTRVVRSAAWSMPTLLRKVQKHERNDAWYDYRYFPGRADDRASAKEPRPLKRR